MYHIIDDNNDVFEKYIYEKEEDFEEMIVSKSSEIFGENGIYFDVKKRIGSPKKGAAIPDGYYLDLTFHDDPRLYLVEIELNTHDVYGHIGEQILRFGISSESDKHKIKNILIDNIKSDNFKEQKINNYIKNSKYSSLHELMDKVLYANNPAAIIIIDEVTPELNNVMGQLTMTTEVIEAETYKSKKTDKKLYRFTPFNNDILENLCEFDDADDIDTIVVPAREEGFNEEFLKNKRWYAIKISGARKDKIRYIASYQVAPVSAITYIAEVADIRKYEDTNKYIVYFKDDTLVKTNKIGLGKNRNIAPQCPKYTSYKKILNAESLDDIWGN